ncbi:MAG: DUF3367 domain-containing protein, partial [Actinomycetia bacterium]|nr:DUF3367 domain-containing protein [Actinomycetes bacterium]
MTPALIAATVAMTWVRPEEFMASGDIAPYLRDGLGVEVGLVWNHQLTGAGSTSYEVVRGIDLVLIRFVELFGGSEMAAQHLLMAGCLAIAAFGASFFTSAFLRQPLAVAVAGLLAVFNPYLLVLLPNPLFPLALGLAGLLAGLLLRANTHDPPSPILLGLVTLPLAYLAVNPPLLAVLSLWTLTTALTARFTIGPGSTTRAVQMLAKAAPVAMMLSLWWTVPFAFTLLGSEGAKVAAQTDVDAWAWSHADNSIAHLVTLEAHWGWAHDFFPFQSYLGHGFWPVLRWILPVGALAGMVLARRRATAATLATIALVGVILAKGLHGPFPGLNSWLYNNVPGLWLLREPMSKMGVVLVLVYVSLFAMALERAIGMLSDRGPAGRRVAGIGLGCVVAGAALAPLPLWNGDVIAQERGMLPSARVELPDEWRQAAIAINRSEREGKTLVLPQNTFYQVTTSWGYHGVDTVISQLVLDPVIQRLPGGYFEAVVGYESLVDEAQAALEKGDTKSAARALQALGVSHVIVRRDLVSDEAGSLDRSAIERSMTELSPEPPIHDSVVASVFAVDGGGPVQIYGDLIGVAHSDSQAGVVGSLALDAASTTSLGVPVDGVVWQLGNSTSAAEFDFTGSGQRELVRIDDGDEVIVSTVTADRSALLFAPVDPVELRVNDEPLDPPESAVMEVEPDAVWGLEDITGVQRLTATSEVRTTAEHSEVRAWASEGSSLLGAFRWVEDCFRFDGRSPVDVGLSAEQSLGTVRLSADAHSACTWAPIIGVEPGQ